MIKIIDWPTILNIWENFLWPNRVSAIETNSAMVYLHGYDMKNMSTTPTFYGYELDGKIVGVNSGHLCGDNSYRSRGLYVFPEYRNRGIGVKLLSATIKQADAEKANMVWSLPRKTSWNTYSKAGFILSSAWHPTETSDENAYCMVNLTH